MENRNEGVNMKKIITALSNKTVNDKLKEYNEIQVMMNDIQYQEGIFETLEINQDIEFIILSELLPGNYNIKELIEKIKQKKNDIKIIIILEKENKELENYLFAKGNINIFYDNEIKIKEIAELIINGNKNEQLEMEIKKLKELIINKEEKNIKYNESENNKLTEKENDKNNIHITSQEKREIEKEIEKEYKNTLLKTKIINNNIIKKVIKRIKKEEIKNNCKIILVTGIAGIGKSVFTVNLSKALEKQKKDVLIIDFDFINNSIQTLFGIKNKVKKKNNFNKEYNIENVTTENYNYEINIENLIFKVSSKIKLISNIDLLFNENEFEDLQFLKIIEELKLKFNFIIIDINNNSQYLKSCMQEGDKIVFLTEPNILQIKKSKVLLEKYINEYKIENEKIYILFNKVKNDCIGFNILKDVFKNYNIIGKINFIKNCNILINQNMKSVYLEKKIKNQYKKISKRISQNNKIKKYYIDKISEI